MIDTAGLALDSASGARWRSAGGHERGVHVLAGDGGPVISFQPDGDIAEAKRELESRGVQFPADVSEHPCGRIATFKDSEGNDLQLYTPPGD